MNHGELSILSFHATKVFTTMEGGAIVSQDEKTKKRIDYLKNFGFANETTIMAPGINSKMNEIQAALGLLQLKSHNKNIAKRSEIAKLYYEELGKVKGISFLKKYPGLENYNFSYFPIFIEEQEYGRGRDELYDILKEEGIYSRRYFYPLISHFMSYRGLDSANKNNLPVAEKIAQKVLCLPIYNGLKPEEQKRVITIIQDSAI